VNMYLTEAGTTSNTTLHSIIKGNSVTSYAAITVLQRTNTQVPAGPYTVNVYAYLSSSPSGGTVRCTHLDISVLGNLS
jgi:hypothetical protein